MEFEVIIGLETHVELSTNTKIFCSCENSFGGEPNSKCCEVCMGFPGSLPHLNHRVVEYAVLAGHTFGCNINNTSYMARKNYVYPDLPKGYQITQGDIPLCEGGSITLSSGRIIRIERIHIEEDAGKLIKKDGAILIDYNRAGVPLIEIVTKPDFRDAKEVTEYLEDLALTMKCIKISDCKMQEGSLRCDVNISVRDKISGRVSERTEIKNVNSFSFIEKAIEYEKKRLISLLESGTEILRETRRFDSVKGITEPMRGKETKEDYRYFKEPDIPSVYISPDDISVLKEKIPPLPREDKMRYISLGLSYEDAFAISKYEGVRKYFNALIEKGVDACRIAKIMLSSAFRFLPEDKREKGEILPTPDDVLYVFKLISEGKIEKRYEKKIFDKMFETGLSFSRLFSESDFAPLSDEELLSAAKDVVAENGKAVSDYLSGKEVALSALLGQLMRKTAGRADAKKAGELIKKLICSKYKS